MKTLIFLLLLLVSQLAQPASVILTWVPPQTGPSPTGYRIFYGPASGSYSTNFDVGNVTSTQINNLTEGNTYFFAAKSLLAGGSPSISATFSNEVSYQVPKPIVNCTNNCSMWGTTVPANIDAGPESSVELGIQFKSTVAGNITAIRFYKASTNLSPHTVTLWNSSGTKLASATSTNETTSGWQLIKFSSPVAIASNTTYVASYHAPTGHYSYEQNYNFANVKSPPLIPIAGVYIYSSGISFPTTIYKGSNYFVDVIFTSGVAPPTLPVPIIHISPN